MFTFGKGPLSLFTNTTEMTPEVYEYKRRKLAQSQEFNESAQQTQSGSPLSSESAGASGSQSSVGPPKNQAAWKKVWPIVALGLIVAGLLLPKINTRSLQVQTNLPSVSQQNPLAKQAWLVEREVQQQAIRRHNEQLAWNKAHPKEAAERLRVQREVEAEIRAARASQSTANAPTAAYALDTPDGDSENMYVSIGSFCDSIRLVTEEVANAEKEGRTPDSHVADSLPGTVVLENSTRLAVLNASVSSNCEASQIFANDLAQVEVVDPHSTANGKVGYLMSSHVSHI